MAPAPHSRCEVPLKRSLSVPNSFSLWGSLGGSNLRVEEMQGGKLPLCLMQCIPRRPRVFSPDHFCLPSRQAAPYKVVGEWRDRLFNPSAPSSIDVFTSELNDATGDSLPGQ